METIATKQPFNNSLRSRFIQTIALTLTLSTIVLSVVVGIRERNILEHSLASKGQSLLSLITKLCQEPLVMQQTLELDTIVHEATKDDDVLYTVVFDQQGNLLTSQFSSLNFRSPELAKLLAGLPRNSELQDILAAVRAREMPVEFSAPVMIDIMTVGAVTVGMSRRSVHQQVTTTMLSVLALNLAAAILLGVVLFLVSRNILLRPITTIAQAANLFAKGDLHTRISIPAPGELQLLVDSFNNMAADLQKTTVSKQYVDDIIGSMHDALFVTTPAGVVTRVNSAACSLLGFDEGELAGQHIDDLLTHEPGVSDGVAATVLRHSSLSTAEKNALTRSGKLVPVLLSASVMRGTAEDVVGIVCMVQDITEQKQAEEKIERSLREKTVMLKEIHHRVKNNLTVVYSLLSLQAKGVADATVRAQFEESQNRVLSMALIHQKLYQSEDLAHVDFKEYLQSLVGSIAATYNRPNVIITVDMDPVALDVNVGIPCGLIVNELVSNCLKYAFPGDKGGNVRVGISTGSEGSHVLFVEDNGIGFPADIDFQQTSSLGLQLVNALTGQIRGKIELAVTGGTSFRITFRATHDSGKDQNG